MNEGQQALVDKATATACRMMAELEERVACDQLRWFERMAMWFKLKDEWPEATLWSDRNYIMETGEWPPWAVDRMAWAPIAGRHPEGCDA